MKFILVKMVWTHGDSEPGAMDLVNHILWFNKLCGFNWMSDFSFSDDGSTGCVVSERYLRCMNVPDGLPKYGIEFVKVGDL